MNLSTLDYTVKMKRNQLELHKRLGKAFGQLKSSPDHRKSGIPHQRIGGPMPSEYLCKDEIFGISLKVLIKTEGRIACHWFAAQNYGVSLQA